MKIRGYSFTKRARDYLTRPGNVIARAVARALPSELKKSGSTGEALCGMARGDLAYPATVAATDKNDKQIK